MPGKLSFFNHCSSRAVGSDTDVLRDPEITFPPSVFPQEPICRTVTIINDTIFENDEIFLVSMSTLRDRVVVDAPAQVTIMDNNGLFSYFTTKKLILCIFNSVAEIGFELSMYTVNEGSDVQICIISSDNVRAVLPANITLVAGSAQSKFFFVEKHLSFIRLLCFQVGLISYRCHHRLKSNFQMEVRGSAWWQAQ